MRDDVLKSAKRAFAEALKTMSEETGRQLAKSAQAGRLHSTAHFHLISEVCEQCFKTGCEAAAVRISEIVGEDAPSYANDLRGFLSSDIERTLSVFRDRARPGASNREIDPTFDKFAARLETACNEIVDAVAHDISLGIAAGKRVEKRMATFNFENKGVMANVQIASPGARQKFSGRQVVAQNDLARIQALLEEVRKNLVTASISKEDKHETEDIVLSMERELASSSPDKSRLNRIGSSLLKRLEPLGLGVLSSAIANALESLMRTL